MLYCEIVIRSVIATLLLFHDIKARTVDISSLNVTQPEKTVLIYINTPIVIMVPMLFLMGCTQSFVKFLILKF